MHWGRVVAAAYALLVLVLALLQIGNVSFEANISIGISTSPPALSAVNSTGTGNTVPGATIAGLVFGIVGCFAFIPALLTFNFEAHSTNGDDSLVPARVLVLFRVLLILSGLFWGTMIFSFVAFGSEAVGGVFIPDLVVAGLLGLLSQVLGWFAFRREPLAGKIVRTNKLVWVALSLSIFGWAGVIAGAVIQLTNDNWVRVTYAPIFFVIMYLQLILMLPLWLKFRNDHGGMPKSHAVVAVITICALFITSATQFGSALSNVVTVDNGGRQIAYAVGYGAFLIAHVLCLVAVVRQRSQAAKGYALLPEDGLQQQPTAPPEQYYSQQPKVTDSFSHLLV